MPLLNLDESITLRMRQKNKVLSALVEIYETSTGSTLGGIEYIRHPVRGCLTVFLAVVVFFASPVLLGFLVVYIAEACGFANPLGMNPGQSVLLAGVLIVTLLTLGLLATMLTLRITMPRPRATIYRDEDRDEVLLNVQQHHLGIRITNTHSIYDAEGQPLGEILHRLRKDQFTVVDAAGHEVAVLTKTGTIYEEQNFTEMAVALAITLIVTGWLSVIALPRGKNASQRYTLWTRDSEQTQTKQEIGVLDLNSANRERNTIYLAPQKDELPDHRLLLALISVLCQP